MNRKFAIAAAIVAAFAFASQSAEAGGRRHHKVDKRVTAVAIGAGVASGVALLSLNDWEWSGWSNSSNLTRLGAYGAVTIGCAAVSPIVATAVVNRPLTQREGHVLIGSCVIPIVGGLLVNAAYDAHPEWEAGYKPRKAYHKRSKAKKKM